MDLRPAPARNRGYRVAALVALSGLLAAVAVLVAFRPGGGELGQPMRLGEPVTVDVPEDGLMVWVRTGAPVSPNLDCTASPLDGQQLVGLGNARMLNEPSLEVDGERWRGARLVETDPPGRYEITCGERSQLGIDATSIGQPPSYHGPRARALRVLAAVGLAGLGLTVGSVLAVVTAVRSRRRIATPSDR